MANKAISELPQAQNVNNQDLFVLEQSGIAKKLTAETFITEQGIIDALAEALDGHGGIQSVTLQSLSGRVRTYRITFTDGSATTFQVLDGNTIDRIAKTSEAGLVSTYTIFMSDGTTSFFNVSNGADGDVSEATLNDALKYKAPVIAETTASSAIANFTDGADDMVMHNIVAEIEPVQDLSNGDPSPTNICPITGHTEATVTRVGKNLAELSASTYSEGQYCTCTYTDTGVTITATSKYARVGYGIPVKKGETYTVKFTGVSTGNYNRVYITSSLWGVEYGSKSLSSTSASYTATFTATSDIVYVGFYVTTNSPSGTMTITNFQLELGSSATTYESYIAPTTASLSWATEAGTVYGGTIDVATGLLTVTQKKAVFSGSENWQLSGSSFFYTQLSGDGRVGAVHLTENGVQVYWYGDSNQVRVYLSNNSFLTTSSNMHDYLDGIGFVYELATPQTYQLSGQQLMTLLGTNNVWADTGDVTVTYPADTKMFIEKLTIPSEDDLVANQAITSGKYFMIGNSLYLALANIASGAQITIGTNAQRVSLADALNTINA